MFRFEDFKYIHASGTIETSNNLVEWLATRSYSEFSVSVLGLNTYCPDWNICAFPQHLWASAVTVP